MRILMSIYHVILNHFVIHCVI